MSAAGWLSLIGHFMAVVVAATVVGGAAGVVVSLVLTASLIGVCVLKGTSPGGPSAWRHFKALREEQRP